MEYRNNEQGQEKEYPLYTEKIVLSPRVKYKRLITIIKILVVIIITGSVYIMSDKLIIPMVKSRLARRNETFDHIEFTRDEYPDMPEQAADDGTSQIKSDYDTVIQSLRSKVDDVARTVVIVKENIITEPGSIDDENLEEDTEEQSVLLQKDIENRFLDVKDEESGASTIGLIVGHINGSYLILTSDAYTAAIDSYSVVVQEENAYKAELVCSDAQTGLSIISIEDSGVTESDRQYMKVATLDNSYVIKKGDIVIAAGKIYGTSGTIDYGTITNRTIYNAVDNNYEIFETNLTSEPGDYGFLFNSDGNVVGISQKNTDAKLKAMGISDLKSMIECMINRQGKMYFGIKAQNVDSELSEKNGIPMGIYILRVDTDSPAYQAGLQPGDIIQGINNTPCYSIQRLNDKIYDSALGQVINISIKRMGKSGYFDASYDVMVELK